MSYCKFITKYLLGLTLFSTYFVSCVAEDVVVIKNDNPIKGSVSLGGQWHTGNLDTKNIESRLALEYDTLQWDNIAEITGRFGHANKQLTAKSFDIRTSIQYALYKTRYAFFKFDLEYDAFATYGMIILESLGHGWIISKSKECVTKIKFGPGGRHSRISEKQDFQNELVGYISAELNKKLSDNTNFRQENSGVFGKNNVKLKTDNIIKVNMTRNLAFELSFIVSYNSNTNDSKHNKHTSTLSKIAWVYNF